MLKQRFQQAGLGEKKKESERDNERKRKSRKMIDRKCITTHTVGGHSRCVKSPPIGCCSTTFQASSLRSAWLLFSESNVQSHRETMRSVFSVTFPAAVPRFDTMIVHSPLALPSLGLLIGSSPVGSGPFPP